MKGRLLPVAVIGLVFFLSAIVWQWNNFSSKQYNRAVPNGTYGRKGQVADEIIDNGSTHRKSGLQQAASKAADNGNEIPTSIDREAAGTSLGNSNLADVAIVLFCYDR